MLPKITPERKNNACLNPCKVQYYTNEIKLSQHFPVLFGSRSSYSTFGLCVPGFSCPVEGDLSPPSIFPSSTVFILPNIGAVCISSSDNSQCGSFRSITKCRPKDRGIRRQNNTNINHALIIFRGVLVLTQYSPHCIYFLVSTGKRDDVKYLQRPHYLENSLHPRECIGKYCPKVSIF